MSNEHPFQQAVENYLKIRGVTPEMIEGDLGGEAQVEEICNQFRLEWEDACNILQEYANKATWENE